MTTNDYGFKLIPQQQNQKLPASSFSYTTNFNPINVRLLTYHLVTAAEQLYPLHDIPDYQFTFNPESMYTRKTLQIDDEGQLHIFISRLFSPHDKNYNSIRKWLESDPRTTADAHYLSLETTHESPDCASVFYRLRTTVPLTEDDKAALHAAGNIHTNYTSSTYETLVCPT